MLWKIACEHANLPNEQHIWWWRPLLRKYCISFTWGRHMTVAPSGEWNAVFSSPYKLDPVYAVIVQGHAEPQRAAWHCNDPHSFAMHRTARAIPYSNGHDWRSPTWSLSLTLKRGRNPNTNANSNHIPKPYCYFTAALPVKRSPKIHKIHLL